MTMVQLIPQQVSSREINPNEVGVASDATLLEVLNAALDVINDNHKIDCSRTTNIGEYGSQ